MKKNNILKWFIWIFIGISSIMMVFTKVASKRHVSDNSNVDHEDEGIINFDLFMGGGDRYVNTEHFKSAHLKARFAGMDVFFSNAKLSEGKGIIDVDVSFGAIELYVPKDWTIQNNVRVTFGAVDYPNKDIAQEDPGKQVVLVGHVSFGAVEIHYVE